jgi:hypothetical protein
MAWVKLFGETWRASPEPVEFQLTLWREDSVCPRQQWGISFQEAMRRIAKKPGESASEKSVVFDLDSLGLSLTDWRRLADREIVSTPAWHESAEFCHEHGHLVQTAPNVMLMDFTNELDGGANVSDYRVTHFVLRTGSLDGSDFPVELDAWLVPENEFWRREPESYAELADTPERAPDLQIMGTGIFAEGWICLPACDDPEATGRRILREEVKLERLYKTTVQPGRRQVQGKGLDDPAFPATLHFRTEKRWGRRRRDAQEPAR